MWDTGGGRKGKEKAEPCAQRQLLATVLQLFAFFLNYACSCGSNKLAWMLMLTLLSTAVLQAASLTRVCCLSLCCIPSPPPTPAGSTTTESEVKKGYKLPRACMTNADVTRLINSDEVQSVVNAPKVSQDDGCDSGWLWEEGCEESGCLQEAASWLAVHRAQQQQHAAMHFALDSGTQQCCAVQHPASCMLCVNAAVCCFHIARWTDV
jgi:hypothetical protein